MRLRVHLSTNYVEKLIKTIRSENPSYSAIDATKHFVDQKYGDWISANMPEAEHEYLIEVTDENYFEIDFTYADDAKAFQRQIGGNQV